MFNRKTKQFFIIAVYLIIFVLVVLGIRDLLTPDPTCSDGIQNQLEQGVDCGGQCQACAEEVQFEEMQVEEVAFVESVSGSYDMMFQIKNPNNLYGASVFVYNIEVTNAAGDVIETQKGKSFILPHETKSIILQRLELSGVPNDANISFEDVKWVEFHEYTEPQLRFVRMEYRPIISGPGFAEVFGLLRNESTLDFHTLNIKVILRDENDEVIALHSTQMKTVKAGEERDFPLIFPERFDGYVAEVEAEAEADIVNAENYIKLYLPGGRFQDH